MFDLMAKYYVWLEDIVAKSLLAIITGLIFIAAVARSFGYPIIWSVDVAQLLFIWLCFLGANRAVRVKGHLGVDMLVRALPRNARWALELFLGVLALIFLVTLGYTGTRLTFLNWQRTFGDSGISYAWVTIAVPVGCSIMSVTLLSQMYRAFRDRGFVFYGEKPIELERLDSQIG